MKKGRESLRDDCMRVQRIIEQNRRISLARMASELDMSVRNARRWVDCFSGCYPLRIESGVVIHEKEGGS
jgi:hypothetical protein